MNSFLPVANGSHFNGNWGDPPTSLIQARCRQSRKLLRVIAGGASRVQVEWANIYTTTLPPSAGASCEIPGPNAVTLRMAIEYPAGKVRQVAGSSAYSAAASYALFDQVTFGGTAWVAIRAGIGQAPADGSAYWARVRRYVVNWDAQSDVAGTVTFAPGEYKQSVPVELVEPMVEGCGVAILGAFDSGSPSGYIPYAGANGAANHGAFVDWIVDAADGLPAVGSAVPDIGIIAQANGNTTPANAGDNRTWTKIPYATALTGDIPGKRCVALFGDSIVQGFGGDVRDGEPAGIFPRALDGTSWWRIAQGGNRASNYAPGNAPWQMSCLARCSSAIVNMAINDILGGATFAQMQSYLTQLWKVLAATGVPIYSGLMTPVSASSDGWATTTNQSRLSIGGPSAFPGDDASFLTSVYGQVSLWLSQDGAALSTPDGQSVKAGQANHPLEAILDWRNFMADGRTSWKWIPGCTADGAHPNTVSVVNQVSLLLGQLEPVVMGRQQQPTRAPAWNPSGQVVEQSMPRTLVRDLNPAVSSSLMSVIDVSPGKFYSQIRAWAGSATPANRTCTVLAGADAAKMKVLTSVTFATPPANSLLTLALPGAPMWVPAGHLLVAVWTPCAANSYGGVSALHAALHTSGSGAVLAGSSTDTGALTGVVNLFTKFTPHTFRVWNELV